MTKASKVRDLEQALIAAKGNPAKHAEVRQQVRDAGLPQLADALDRIADQSPE